MKRLACLLPVLAVACSSGEPAVSVTNASPEEVTKAAKAAGASAPEMTPGRWEASATIDGVDMPGMPQMAEQMKANMSARTFAYCLTPEEAKRPRGGFFGGDNSPDCRYDHFRMGGGTIDAAMTCTIAGTTQKSALKGSYGPDAYRMTVVSNTGSGAMAAKISMTMEAKRTGACTGAE